MIDPNLVTLERKPDGSVAVMYEDWYICTITRHGSMRRHFSCAHPDIQQTPEDGKIKLVK